mmetsp:Transcript_49223/g.112827  ORF Transcript_49223/g.112827 Transcript_49223/m.112827 type:complete len:215 (-) Transcript_49223:89-733(-)
MAATPTGTFLRSCSAACPSSPRRASCVPSRTSNFENNRTTRARLQGARSRAGGLRRSSLATAAAAAATTPGAVACVARCAAAGAAVMVRALRTRAPRSPPRGRRRGRRVQRWRRGTGTSSLCRSTCTSCHICTRFSTSTATRTLWRCAGGWRTCGSDCSTAPSTRERSPTPAWAPGPSSTRSRLSWPCSRGGRARASTRAAWALRRAQRWLRAG